MAFTKQVIARGVRHARFVVAADFDEDGDIDAAATSGYYGQIRYYEQDGQFKFQESILDRAVLLHVDLPQDLLKARGHGFVRVLGGEFDGLVQRWREPH